MQLGLRCVNLQALGVALLCLIVVCSACFVRNCPPGGKRSLVPAERECMRCGPKGMGQCIGPNICCGTAIGCFINTMEAAVCAMENEVRTPCEINGNPCGPSGDGRCVAFGVCCTDQKCTLDHSCEDSGNAMDMRDGSYNPELMRMLRQWLDKRSFPVGK